MSASETPLSKDTFTRLQQAISTMSRLTSRAALQRAMGGQDDTHSPTERWLLAHLAQAGPTRMSDLARWQSVDKSTMTAQIQRLERAGLVTRGPDPTDRRASLATLTPEGEQVTGRHQRAAREVFTRIVTSWSEAERESLVGALEKLADGMAAELDPQHGLASGAGR